MGSRISFILLLYLGSVSFGMFNLSSALSAAGPHPKHLTASIAAVLLLVLTGFLMSYKQLRFFIRWYSGYWLFGAILLLLGYLTHSYAVFMPVAFIYIVPFYGFVRWFPMLSEAELLYTLIALPLVSGYTGYLLGRLRNRKAHPAG